MLEIINLVTSFILVNKFLAPLLGIENKNLNINIPTKERIANLDIFLYFIKNFKKSQK